MSGSIVVAEWPLLMQLVSIVLILGIMFAFIASFTGVGFSIRCLFLDHRWGEWTRHVEEQVNCLECGSAISDEKMWRITSDVRHCKRCGGSEERGERRWKRVEGSWVPEESICVATEKERREIGVEKS